MKKILTFLFLLLTAVTVKGAETLLLADATGGAAADVFLQAGITLAREKKMEVSMRRILPGKALEEFDAGKLDGIVIDRRFAGKRYFVPIAAEALSLYVSTVNPGADLTPKQILQILTAPRPTWEFYNHLDMDIQRIAISPAQPSGTLLRRVFGKQDYSKEIFMVKSVSSGFAFTNSASLFFAPFTALPPTDLKMLPVNGVMPTTASVRSGKYPLALHYVLICRKDSAAVKMLIETLGKESFRKEMQRSGFLVMLP